MRSLRAFELQRGQVHADGAVAGRRREDRHAGAIRRRHEAAMLRPFCVILACRQIFADEIVELRRAERLLKRLAAAELAIEAIGAEQVFVIEDDVVDADDLILAQGQVVEAGPRLVHVHAEGEVRVVVEIGAGAR